MRRELTALSLGMEEVNHQTFNLVQFHNLPNVVHAIACLIGPSVGLIFTILLKRINKVAVHKNSIEIMR